MTTPSQQPTPVPVPTLSGPLLGANPADLEEAKALDPDGDPTIDTDGTPVGEADHRADIERSGGDAG